MLNRRLFITELSAALAAGVALSGHAAEKRPARLILRSSWQTVNIGDIAHTPGVLHLLEKHLPDVEIRLWPSSVDNGVEDVLRARFPKLIIIKTSAEIKAAFAECDFLLHGSGPSLVAEKHVEKWRVETGKPYGIYGITFKTLNEQTRITVDHARFIYFRDSGSLEWAKSNGYKCPIMEFSPDGAFAVDLRNDAAAEAFMSTHGLEQGKFLCCIPRYRFTPYWKIKKQPFNEEKHARNEAMKEHDHAPLREAIIAVVKQTDMKVLICPEDRSQMEIGKEMLVDKLPDDVKAKIVWRENYWLTDEALSTYTKSAGLFGLEMHSPIMCIGNGIPAIVCRFEEQTSKGLMWRDIGLGDWLFDMDKEDEVARIVPTVLSLAKDPATAKEKAVKAQAFVNKRFSETMAVVKGYLPTI